MKRSMEQLLSISVSLSPKRIQREGFIYRSTSLGISSPITLKVDGVRNARGQLKYMEESDNKGTHAIFIENDTPSQR